MTYRPEIIMNRDTDKTKVNLVQYVLNPAQQVNQRVLKLYTHLKPDTVIKRPNFIDPGHQMGTPSRILFKRKLKVCRCLPHED